MGVRLDLHMRPGRIACMTMRTGNAMSQNSSEL